MPDETPSSGGPTLLSRALKRVRAGIGRRLRAARDIYEGLYIAPYRSAIHREYLRQHDAFMLMGFSDLLGVPNPVQFYMLELYPSLIEEFHEWHLRMGMEHPPEGGFRCC
ncbi:MAG: cory-CC-star protein [Gemmatimonadota bacterium]|nr:cory-CC-star protein [Gemmatimonadota bacterium]